MTKWRTSLTRIEPNKILVRGYPLDEVMGRLTFGESIYLLLMGEVPSPAIGSLMEAILVSFIDHGITPPSTLSQPSGLINLYLPRSSHLLDQENPCIRESPDHDVS